MPTFEDHQFLRLAEQFIEWLGLNLQIYILVIATVAHQLGQQFLSKFSDPDIRISAEADSVWSARRFLDGKSGSAPIALFEASVSDSETNALAAVSLSGDG
jgi:hypothetical protein